jgi:hypothetical protein
MGKLSFDHLFVWCLYGDIARTCLFPSSDSFSLIASLFLFRGHFFSFTKMVERPGEMKANILPRFRCKSLDMYERKNAVPQRD